MMGITQAVLLVTGILALLKALWSLNINIKKGKRSGLPYVVGPFYPIGYILVILAELSVPVLCRIPIIKRWDWLHVVSRQASWSAPRSAEGKYGDTFLVVGMFNLYLKTSNAELVNQITTRRTNFLKPVEFYKVVDIFGKSILTQEGEEWRRHKKIVAPSFSEKSNRLVFEESIRQTESMMNMWAANGRSSRGELHVKEMAVDAAMLSMHVICAAGFGVQQLWPNENEEELKGQGISGFSDSSLKNGHTLPFQESLTQLLKNLPWLVIFPPGLLRKSPFKGPRLAHQAFQECMAYLIELLESKKQRVLSGEKDGETMDLLGPMIQANYNEENAQNNAREVATLTRDELLGNAFIFLFAGHETTANNIHYAILELAMSIPAQRSMQRDIDKVLVGKSVADFCYYADMPRLWNSMVGAVLQEQLRLMPAVINIPKKANGDQTVTIDGTEYVIPDTTYIHLNVIGTHRNPRYWPQSPDSFIPERWLQRKQNGEQHAQSAGEEDDTAAGLTLSDPTTESIPLFKPTKGSYIPFSDGHRACPGQRFAQVEATAVLSTIFQKHSVELDVSEWASDEELEFMGKYERKEVYEKAIMNARKILRRCQQNITLHMRPGDFVPLRFVERGRERFRDCFE